MSADSDTAEIFTEAKAWAKARRDHYAVNCPRCNEVQPKRQPTRLMPAQRCKVDGYRDPRPRLAVDGLGFGAFVRAAGIVIDRP